MTEPESYFIFIFSLLALGALIPIATTVLRLRSGIATTASLLLALAGSDLITFYAIKFLIFEGNKQVRYWI